MHALELISDFFDLIVLVISMTGIFYVEIVTDFDY